jgi:DNA-binding transcriptional ArsR family regulator
MNGKSPRTVLQDAPSWPYDAILDALGDPTRRAILDRLREGPKPVVEIARGLPVGRPAVSQHLKVLKQAGLVADRAVGTRRIYAVDADGMATVSDYAQSFWTAALTRYACAARRAKQPTRARRRAIRMADEGWDATPDAAGAAHQRVDVPLSPEEAFQPFTDGIQQWDWQRVGVWQRLHRAHPTLATAPQRTQRWWPARSQPT